MKHLFVVLCLILSVYAQSQVPSFKWAKNITSGVITHDGSGNVYITGNFLGSADFDPGPGSYSLTSAGSGDIFMVKLDINGNFVWAKGMGSTGDDQGMDLAVDASGNIYLASYFSSTVNFNPGGTAVSLSSSGSSDVAIAKYDSNGNLTWAKKIGGPNTDIINGIAVDGLGNVYTTGYFMDLADFDPSAATYTLATNSGINDAFVLKLDASGNMVWAKDLGGTANTLPKSITLDASGNIYTTGEFTGICDFNPSATVYNLSSLTSTYKDCYISKLDASGNFVWAKQIGGSDHDLGYCIRTDNSGNLYTVGNYSGLVDFDPAATTYTMTTTAANNGFVLKLDAAGNFIWAKQTQGTTAGITSNIRIDASSNLYIGGRFSGTVDFDPDATTATLTSYGSFDVFLSKWNSSGNYLWAQQFGGTSNDMDQSMTVDANENVFLTGTYSGVADFDPGPGTYSLAILGTNFALRLSACPTASLTLTGQSNVLCHGLSTGSISVSATGGSGFNYNWAPFGSSSPSISGIPAGTYTAVATNSCANTASLAITITEPPALTNTNSGSQFICSTQSVSLHMTAGGGVLPYTYAWTPSTGLSATNASMVTASPAATTTYTFTITDANGCGSGGSLNVTVNSLKDISGTVTESTNAVAGAVTLYEYEPFLTKFDSITTQTINGTGAYTFTAVPPGSYIVKATPTSGTLQVTYGGSATGWKNATVSTHSCVTTSTQNINVVPFAVIGSGPGSLSGTITQTVGFGQRPASPYSPLAPGQPIGGIVVKGGKNPGGNMFAQTTTGTNGTYTLSGLPANTGSDYYFILVDIPGLDTNSTYRRIISTGNLQYTDLDFTVDSVKINPVSNTTGINNLYESPQSVSLFPNPASQRVTLQYTLQQAALVSIELTDVLGKTVRIVSNNLAQEAGLRKTMISLNDLESGMYFIRLKTGRTENTLRLMIND